MMTSIFGGIAAALVAVCVTLMLIPIARRIGLVDIPSGGRKVHKKPTALVGGFGILIGVVVVLMGASHVSPELLPVLSAEKWTALIAATIIIFLIGTIDDLHNLSPRVQIIGPIVAAILVSMSGIVVGKITNPSGGVFSFDSFPLFAGVLTFTWLMGMMYSTKLLDGLDGLSTGLSGIGAVMIFALTQTHAYYQPQIGFVALVFAGACFGFLILNFNPARAFLGEGGSLFVGFTLALLAILSGSKIATALIVMGLPVVDVARVIVERKLRGHPVAQGDDQHLHHLLLANGLSHRTAVLLYYFVGFLFGGLALFLQSRGKIILLVILVVIGLLCAQALRRKKI